MKIILRKNNIILLLYVLMVAIYTLPTFSVELFVYALIGVSYLNIVIIVMGLYYTFKNEDLKVFLFSCAILACGIIICILNGTDIRNLNNYMALVLGLYYTTSLSYSKDFYKILSIVGVAYNLYSFILSPVYYDTWMTSSNNMMNPNTIGIMNLVFAIIVNSYINLTVKKRSVRKILFLVYNGIIAYTLYLYRGRTSQFAFVVFLILLFIINDDIIKRYKLMSVLVFLTIVGGFVFPPIYINMPKTIINWVADTTGKPYFSGREIIWSRFFLSLTDTKNFLIGPGSWRKAEFTTLWNENRVYSMHNNYMDILLCFGLVGAIIFLIFTTRCVSGLCKSGKVNNYVSLCGFFCFLILGYSENTFNYAFFAVLTNLLMGMSLYDNQNSDIELESTSEAKLKIHRRKKKLIFQWKENTWR